MTALEQLLAQTAGMTLSRVPPEVLQQARLCILDTIACILAGARTEEAALMLACEPGQLGDRHTVMGTAHQRSLHSAIRINAYLGDVLELNDLIGGHASIGNVVAALSLGQSLGASGTRVLEAVVRGIEVTCRVYESVYPSLRRYTEMAMVPVGMPSTFGTAAAAAHLLELNETQTMQALAIAGAMAGWCPAEVIFGSGGSVKPMLFGAQPADIGVTAAYYARAGMTGPTALLDSKVGYFAMAATQGHFDAQHWANRWALHEPRRKLHACCGYLHAPVDALGLLRKQVGAAALKEASIEVRVAPYVADVVNKMHVPSSPNDARFHLQYSLAQVACGTDVILPDHSIQLSQQLLRDDLIAAMGRVTVIQDAALSHYHHCSVTVRDTEGFTYQQSLTAPRGSPQSALSDCDVQAKFSSLAEPVLGQAASEEIFNACMQIESLGDVGVLMDKLSTSVESFVSA